MLRGCYRLTCDVAVDPLQRIRGRKREHAREHLVQDNAQGVEITAPIRRSIHAPGLFRRHVLKRAGNKVWRYGRLPLSRQLGRDAKAGEPCVSVVVDESVGGLQFLMDEALSVDVTERGCQADGNGQQAGQIERLSLCCSMTRSSGSPPGSLRTRSARPRRRVSVSG